MTEYNNGAITALSYMAEQGASKSDVQLVADVMNISFNNIDDSDKKRFMDAYGDFPFVQYSECGERCEP
ncbi:hypothetical protein [Shewanella sp. T24-MNA-CIBAN-0130]|uniref:hypothetical protein n=1 Tax=Shewanella sp. T24-MNA-CIBAN-0130 TaxID=3140470 RepID=UPI0033293E82